MERQLHLLHHDTVRPPRQLQLDAKTRAVGRRGLAQARAALRAAQSTGDPAPFPSIPPSSSNVRRSAA